MSEMDLYATLDTIAAALRVVRHCEGVGCGEANPIGTADAALAAVERVKEWLSDALAECDVRGSALATAEATILAWAPIVEAARHQAKVERDDKLSELDYSRAIRDLEAKARALDEGHAIPVIRDWPRFWSSLTDADAAACLKAAPRVAGEWENTPTTIVRWEAVRAGETPRRIAEVRVENCCEGLPFRAYFLDTCIDPFDCESLARLACDAALRAAGWRVLHGNRTRWFATPARSGGMSAQRRAAGDTG